MATFLYFCEKKTQRLSKSAQIRIQQDVKRLGTLSTAAQQRIQRVLLAWASYNPVIGYVQGMESIVYHLLESQGCAEADAFQYLRSTLDNPTTKLDTIFQDGLQGLWCMAFCVQGVLLDLFPPLWHFLSVRENVSMFQWLPEWSCTFLTRVFENIQYPTSALRLRERNIAVVLEQVEKNGFEGLLKCIVYLLLILQQASTHAVRSSIKNCVFDISLNFQEKMECLQSTYPLPRNKMQRFQHQFHTFAETVPVQVIIQQQFQNGVRQYEAYQKTHLHAVECATRFLSCCSLCALLCMTFATGSSSAMKVIHYYPLRASPHGYETGSTVLVPHSLFNFPLLHGGTKN